ncbi:hypothetical protein AQUCO_01100409v1 [Aquilegia coerulea]|uniref:Sieve element occlusion N-terminal domain-containing protein n=1 Tax=Aquilegia coerulea TaxID=218851 RepID=A0A2G5E6Y2_AQUCA|nr:hypothetical protein AQUCO_01100409v1 [Aquilegia coerulea]
MARRQQGVESELLNLIQATHSPDGQEFDVKPLLNVVEKILQDASTFGIEGLSHPNSQAQIDAVHKLSSEISRLLLGASGIDYHTNTLALLEKLSSYSWEAKMVMALSAFGVNYGEFWLMTQFYPLIIMEENEHMLRPRYEALKNLIKIILDLTKLIVEFQELPLQWINNNEEHASLVRFVPSAAYWTVRSILFCSSHILGLIALGQQENITHTDQEWELEILLDVGMTTAEAWELSSYTHKLNNMHAHLYGACSQGIDRKNDAIQLI